MEPLLVDIRSARYTALIGVGGIGSGVFFKLSGDHTLGREESRGGRFLDQRDYCKLHIITHYVQTLLGPDFRTYPIGFVGDDATGERLLAEMGRTGFDLRYVRSLPGEQTLFSTCFIYPDGSGGNLTTEDSANSKVSPQDVRAAGDQFRQYQGKGIALAAPEVSMETRLALLEMASRFDFLRAASLTTTEIDSSLSREILRHTDFLAINLDEAAALAKADENRVAAEEIVRKAVDAAGVVNPDIRISITAGKQGSWVWDGKMTVHRQAVNVSVVNTAGAGDAHFGGMLTGLAAGLTMQDAQVLGNLVAALSVTSPHTIHPAIERPALLEFAISIDKEIPLPVMDLFRSPARPA